MLKHDKVGKTRYSNEKKFFDQIAENSEPFIISHSTLERYAKPRNPMLFSKEMMFSLLPKGKSLKVLEIGCGQGVASVQLAYRGSSVTAVDISEKSIEFAKKLANINNVYVDFKTGNIETDQFPECHYDVVWCDCILHHIIPSLNKVISNIYSTLVPGGLFIAREPIAYAKWLKKVRSFVPVREPCTPDEQPLRDVDFQIIKNYFSDIHKTYFRLLARIDVMKAPLKMIAAAARIDNCLLHIPGFSKLAGEAVFWTTK